MILVFTDIRSARRIAFHEKIIVFAVHIRHYFGVILLQVHFCEHLSIQLESFEQNLQAFLIDIVDDKYLLTPFRVFGRFHIALVMLEFWISALLRLPFVRGLVAYQDDLLHAHLLITPLIQVVLHDSAAAPLEILDGA